LIVSDGAALVSGTATVGVMAIKCSSPAQVRGGPISPILILGGNGNRLGLSDGAGLICSNANVSTQSSGDANTVSLTGAEASNKFVKH